MFSFYLGRCKDKAGLGSELTLGGRNHAKFTGEVTRVNVAAQGYWQICLDAIDVNGDSIEGTIGEAIIDTGSTMATAPTAVAAAISARIPHAVMYSYQKLADGDTTRDYAYPCETPAEYVPALRFVDKQFPIDPKKTSTQGYLSICHLTKGYNVSDAFLKNWYSVFNNGDYLDERREGGVPASVSFAKAI